MRRLGLALLLFLIADGAFAAAVKPQPVVPEPVAVASPTWEGPQFVRADKAGKVYFFRGSEFTVYPLGKSGELGEPLRLETTAAASQLVQDAVLSPAGDTWLVYADLGVRLFIDGKEKPVPSLSWRPWSVGFLRNTPMIAVLPTMVGEVESLKELSAVPWFLSFDKNRWLPAVEHRNLRGKDLLENRRDQNELVADYAVFFTGDAEGKLWVGRQYAYALQRLSPSGRPLLEITVDGGKVKQKKETPDSAGDPAPGKNGAKYHRFNAQPVIRDLALGRDHRLYVLAVTAGGLVIDRYDPARVVLERLPLAAQIQGRLTLAAGKDALYLAAWNGQQGRWKISWEALDSASWQEIPGVEIRSGTAE